ncbi:hypothetical protein I580_01183 [Enterococcus caccae ATCC BAA-1240]|uniref:Uncharacterized protein n=1 Tax=Enterococcus caccae ATCC BAA-1240 TaxID=1158612 RepID=R3U510_9ENTE|nr:hypothetical protein UC7_00879 [Enterococcus caccae ATCC BAA-1240]EOT65427.1 hypothetical protein I580_01183 [Enterococcus caccae ATCC BAA-1240]
MGLGHNSLSHILIFFSSKLVGGDVHEKNLYFFVRN